jgi:uncharacterized protein YjbI with pentapeptide repeats
LEKVGQGWRRVRPYLLGFLVVLVVVGAILALIYVPKMQVPVCPPGQEGLPPKICFDIENEARKTLAYILGGILAIIGIYMAHRRIRALERQVQIGQEQLQVAQEGQITERFTRAIEQLGSDKMEIRLGGIYALERIANDSDKDYWTIMETLTAFVRERAPWRNITEEKTGEASGEEPAAPDASASTAPAARPKPATDIQAVLTVLGRRKFHYEQGETEPLDFRNTDLRGADLKGAHLEKANLSEAHLMGALLRKAHLEGADLRGAHLKRADLSEAHLEGANLSRSHLERAELYRAQMEGAFLLDAYLEGAVLAHARLEGAILYGAHLERAVLEEAHLQRANLRKAHLEGADLDGAHLKGTYLEGVDLGVATGLTRRQLAEAIIDEKTILPDYLQEEPKRAKDRRGMTRNKATFTARGGHLGKRL